MAACLIYSSFQDIFMKCIWCSKGQPSAWEVLHTLVPHVPPDSVRHRASLVAQTVKNLPAVQETEVQSPGQEDLLEKEMATHSSMLAWKISWAEEPGRLKSVGSGRVGHD